MRKTFYKELQVGMIILKSDFKHEGKMLRVFDWLWSKSNYGLLPRRLETFWPTNYQMVDYVSCSQIS
jgi:hypothetical protein